MPTFDIEGRLVEVYETQSKTSTFSTREFVIETLEQYPQFVKFQLTQERCPLIDTFNKNEVIKVSFDIRGREWQGKYLTNLNAWRLQSTVGPTNELQTNADPFADNFPTASQEPLNVDDDLPF